jgi:hypothetical protein
VIIVTISVFILMARSCLKHGVFSLFGVMSILLNCDTGFPAVSSYQNVARFRLISLKIKNFHRILRFIVF